MKQFVLVGNFGVGNLGDEALKEYFLSTFKDVTWTVVSATPSEANEVPRLPCGLRSLRTSWWRTLRAYRKSDGVIFGGGSLFTDVESWFACILWWWHASVARWMRKPVYLAFQGIGPFHTRIGTWCAKNVCGFSSGISVRDRVSEKRVRSWNLNTNIVQSFDPVFSLIEDEKYENSSQNVFIVIPRKNSGASFVSYLETLVHDTASPPDEVRIVLMQPDDAREASFARLLMACIPQSIRARIIPAQTIAELSEEICRAQLVLTERYHGGLVSLAMGVETVVCSQKDGDKLDALAHLLHEGVTPESLREDVLRGQRDLASFLEG